MGRLGDVASKGIHGDKRHTYYKATLEAIVSVLLLRYMTYRDTCRPEDCYDVYVTALSPPVAVSLSFIRRKKGTETR